MLVGDIYQQRDNDDIIA